LTWQSWIDKWYIKDKRSILIKKKNRKFSAVRMKKENIAGMKWELIVYDSRDNIYREEEGV